MKTPPFYRHRAHVTGVNALAPIPERYPYHDVMECPFGQAIKQSGEWRYYNPTTVAETRARCPHCIALDK